MCQKYLNQELVKLCSTKKGMAGCKYCHYKRDYFDNIDKNNFDSIEEYEDYILKLKQERILFEEKNLKGIKLNILEGL